MRNNLINKIIVTFACAFVMIFASTKAGFAQNVPDLASAPAHEEISGGESDDLLNLDEMLTDDKSGVEEDIVLADEIDTAPAEENVSTSTEAPTNEVDTDFLNNDVPTDSINSAENDTANQADVVAAADEKAAPMPSPLLDVQPFPDNSDLDSLEVDVNKAQIDSTADVDDVIPEIGEEKSPFESFGNAILSKVDNDLFNQMSNIEKQTTLLRLELRREELKSRVEALRNARLKAQQEEDARLKAEEEKAKDLEAERQVAIIAEQEKLKQKEIELEKVRQAKMVNDYMNEMLIANQKWVAQNAQLQKKVHELEEEKQKMNNGFKEKLAQINANAEGLVKKAENVAKMFRNKMEAMNRTINNLQSSMAEREDELKQMSNPFSGDGAPGEDAIDMSRDYAIMDITGKGDDIVAKIISTDGKTFIIHKGSKLKNGEVVTSITDHYISFENDGVQSYLYTGGTVMEYEPMVTFNSADKTPVKTDKQIIKNENTGKNEKQDEPVLIKKPRKTMGDLTFGSGTFVQ